MPIDRLLEIMSKLRDPNNGCPWDLEQTFQTIAPYTLEEAYEVREAITNNDYDSLKDELGDLLLQIVFHSQIAAESDIFNFENVVDSICNKMVERHPHVFGNANIDTADAQLTSWEAIKSKEREKKQGGKPDTLSEKHGVIVP